MTRNNLYFNNKNAVIVYHDSVYGPPHELRDYLLRNKINNLFCIGHVNRYLADNPVKYSYCELYQKGKIVFRKQNLIHINTELFQYFVDSLLTLYWTIKYSRWKIDYFIGLGNLNVFMGIILQVFGKVRYTIYYVIDYVPHRFTNPFVNNVYHLLDYICVKLVTVTWNYSYSMIDARKEKYKLELPRQIVTPNGVHIRKDIIKSDQDIDINKLIYIGSLAEPQGLQLVIKSLKLALKIYPNLHLAIIGSGPYRKELENLVKITKIGKSVNFYGRVEDPIEADKIISSAIIGFATYTPDNKIVYTTEPGKVKKYLSLGVPVIMTEVGHSSKDVIKYKCGFVVDYDAKQISETIIKIIKNIPEIYKYRKNAISYASKYQWDEIFTRAFEYLNQYESK
jgi:glycosyltransferase involved in cell wall biosynthesis